MAIVIPTEGELQALKLILGAETAEDLLLKLFVNNYVPVKGSTGTSFTEPVGGGYAAITLTKNTDWTFTSGNPSRAETTFKTFTFTGAVGTVYGYWVQGSVSDIVYWCERFDSPSSITTNGDKIIIPVMQTCE